MNIIKIQTDYSHSHFVMNSANFLQDFLFYKNFAATIRNDIFSNKKKSICVWNVVLFDFLVNLTENQSEWARFRFSDEIEQIRCIFVENYPFHRNIKRSCALRTKQNWLIRQTYNASEST